MARDKSDWRRAIAPRELRWRASRALVAAAPALRRPLNFYGAAISMEQAATAHLLTETHTVTEGFTEAEQRFVQERCRKHDGPAREAYWRAPWTYATDFHLISEVEMLGHTGVLAAPAAGALISETGQAENRNRDKIALLKTGAAPAERALPVRRYSNYFHFMLEAALPLTAYLEVHGGAGPHVIVSPPIGPGFIRGTLEALSARYGARLIELRADEKIPLAEAVAWRRTTPCSDWPMARRETAAALQAALLAWGGERLDPEAGRRLYLRRGKEKIRNLTNAEAVDRLAAEKGYEVLEPASKNLARQAALPAGADRIFAVHGTALANLIFAKRGAVVTELFAEDFCKSVYMNLCRQLGLTHQAVLSPPGDYRQNFEANLAGLTAAL